MSEFFEIFFIGLILSIDSFSAAIAMGTRPFLKKDAIKFAFTSGVSEALVALIGAFAGAYLIKKFQAFDHWIAFSLLMAVSLNMAYEGFSDLFCKEQKEEKSDFHSFFKILIVSLATSLDAFGVGIGLGIAKDSVSLYIISIGIWAFLATIGGLYLAKIISKKSGAFASLFGSAVLALIAVKMLSI